MSNGIEAGAPAGRGRPGSARRWAAILLLAALPIILGLVGFVRLPLHTDSLFYGYQLKRAGEESGRWWRVAEDPLLGQPYQGELAVHAGLYEGVDLMVLAAGPSRFLNPKDTYFFAAFVALALNGWVIGWLTLRMTGSPSWAALAVVLITWNFQTAIRYLAHLHLFKYAWPLLAMHAFGRYLDGPSARRGAWLGLAAALSLQGSFYLGYLLLVGLGAYGLAALLAGKLGRAHAGATAAAGAVFAVAGFAMTFPVWTIAKGRLFSDDFFQRDWSHTWIYGAELWQYLLPQTSPLGHGFVMATRHHDESLESWNYPGLTILLAVGLYLVARARGWRHPGGQGRFLDLLLSLMGIFVVLSLAGGPGFFLFKMPGFSGIRCYGRAGMLAIAAGCLAAPLIYQGLLGSLRSRGLRGAAVAGILALTAYDARLVLGHFSNKFVADCEKALVPPPAWVRWLSRQPADVHLAAFSLDHPGHGGQQFPPMYWWGIDPAGWRLRHGHATLNGGDLRLLNGDLNLLGASHDRMNAAGLRFVVALGYETLAFHETYLKAHPWIPALPWLDRVEQRGGWTILRANRSMPPLGHRALADLLADQPRTPRSEAVAVPPGAWITGQLRVGRETVVGAAERVSMGWVRTDGTPAGGRTNALFQHVFGPSMPAFRARTPAEPGDYDLVFLDPRGERLCAIPYRVASSVRTVDSEPDRRIRIATTELGGKLADGSSPLRLVVENASGLYLQAIKDGVAVPESVAAHPGLVPSADGSLVVALHVAGDEAEGRPDQVLPVRLPRDLPPGGRIELEVPADQIAGAGRIVALSAGPAIGHYAAPAPADEVEVRLAPGDGPEARLTGSSERDPEATTRR